MQRTIHLSPVVDSTLERVGFPLDHPYLEQVYCSVLGPSSVLLLRHMGRQLAEHPGGVDLDLVDTSRRLGLGLRADDDAEEIGRRSPIARTVDRLAQFKLVLHLSEDTVGVHRRVPALSRGRVLRLTDGLRDTHDRMLTEHLSGLVAVAEGRPAAARSAADRLTALARRSPTVEPRSLTR